MVEIGPVGYEGEVDYVKSLQTGRWNGGQNEIKKSHGLQKIHHVGARLHQRICLFFLSNVLM